MAQPCVAEKVMNKIYQILIQLKARAINLAKRSIKIDRINTCLRPVPVNKPVQNIVIPCNLM